MHAAKFRAHGRIPILSYIHPATGATLCRSSQPLPGLTNKRSVQDERLVMAGCTGGSGRLLIVDARPTAAALANAVQGKGSENVEYYGGEMAEKCHLHLINIHAVRDAAGHPDEWMKSIKRIIDGARRIHDALSAGVNVLVHCSDGWDRTPQLTSLAMLMCEPEYYKGLQGLGLIVGKEWLLAGHRFSTRNSHLAPPESLSEVESTEASPTFLQFIRAVSALDEGITCNDIIDLSYQPDGPFAGDCDRLRRHHLSYNNYNPFL